MSVYIEQFKNNEDIISEYSAPADALDGAEVLLAWYGYGSYCGASLVIYRKDGQLWRVDGGHCSCNGLEGQWEPETTSVDAIEKMDYSGEYDGASEVNEQLKALATQLRS